MAKYVMKLTCILGFSASIFIAIIMVALKNQLSYLFSDSD